MTLMCPIITAKRIHQITANGDYRLGGPGKCFSAAWTAGDVAPSGTLTLSFDDDPGANPDGTVIDFGATGDTGSRAVSANMNLPFIDVRVEGLPQGGSFDLYIL